MAMTMMTEIKIICHDNPATVVNTVAGKVHFYLDKLEKVVIFKGYKKKRK